MDVIDKFFKSYYQKMQEFFLKFESERFGLTQENYWSKVLEVTNVKDEDFKPSEDRLNLKFPPLFKEFYKRAYSLEFEFDFGVSLCGTQREDKLEKLFDFMFKSGCSEQLIDLNLIPFGFYQDAFFICLDYRKSLDNPSISLFEMPSWELGAEAISQRTWFSDYEKFLNCMVIFLDTGDYQFFDSIDPHHNFRTAYDSWIKLHGP